VPSPQGRVFSFGPFRLVPRQHVLLDGGKAQRLGSRALAILTALVERPGEVVSKSDLMSVAWPDTHVEDDNLKVHVSALRRALGDGSGGTRYIVSVSGRGYAFVAPVTVDRVDEAPTEGSDNHNLPPQLTRLVGRAEPVTHLSQECRDHRLVTIVGAGGIGKTSVALAVAEASIAAFEHGVWWADFAPTRDAALLPNVLANVLGVRLVGDDPIPELVRTLRDRQMLIVLDNCEHVVDAVAHLALEIMRAAPRVRFLATSREPLRVENEHLYRLAPLEFPSLDDASGRPDLRTFPAIQLLIERATAASADLEIKDADLPVLAEICRGLDGIPLAIEFVAPYVGVLGVRGTASRLGDRLNLLPSRRNVVLDRHQTLRATHDWSYALLDEAERTVLRRLSVFADRFALDAASQVASGDGLTASDVVDGAASLVMKSLVSVDVSGAQAHYRLLDTTRAYAFEKLRDQGEFETFIRRYAAYYAGLLFEGWSDKQRLFESGGYASLRDHLDNIRAALQWCFSPAGDLALGVRLAAGAGVYFVELGLTLEARTWSELGLGAIEDALRGTAYECMLQYAFAHALVLSSGNADESQRAILRTLELAVAAGDKDLELRALGGCHIFLCRTGHFNAAMPIALRARDVADETADPEAIATAYGMLSESFYYAGDRTSAHAACETALQKAPPDRKLNTIRFGFDQRIRALTVLAASLWHDGKPGLAATASRETLDFSLRSQDPILIVIACYWGATIALLSGDWRTAEDMIPLMEATGRKYLIEPFPALAAAFEAEMAFRRQGGPMSPARLETTFEAVRSSRYNPSYHAICVVEALTQAGRYSEARTLVDDLVAEMEQGGQALFIPEYHRLRGDILAAEPGADTTEAMGAYQAAIDLAREQSSLAWELRAAIGLARLQRRDDPVRAASLLAPLCARYADGFETVDLAAAKTLLRQLS
jgi:predicted ATPase/DNA-binding winged helix-turn-helix (wHTH) protein